jgi:hypothetical protein
MKNLNSTFGNQFKGNFNGLLLQKSNKTFYRCDHEEQENFYNSYMEGFYYVPDNNEDDED